MGFKYSCLTPIDRVGISQALFKCLGHLISALGHLFLFTEVNTFKKRGSTSHLQSDLRPDGSCKLSCSESDNLALLNVETLSLLVCQVPGSHHAVLSRLGDQEKDVQNLAH